MLPQLTQMRVPAPALAVMLLAPLLAGCEEDDQQLLAMQADVTHSASELVESDARARKDWIELQEGLEVQRAEIGRQRDALEEDRRRIAVQRRSESFLSHVSLLIICCLPLVICWLLLRQSSTDDGAEVVCDVLIDDLSAEHPRLLAPPQTRRPPEKRIAAN